MLHLASRVVKYLVKYVIYKTGGVAQPGGHGAGEGEGVLVAGGGATAPSEHHRGTLEQGTEGPGPCDELGNRGYLHPYAAESP